MSLKRNIKFHNYIVRNNHNTLSFESFVFRLLFMSFELYILFLSTIPYDTTTFAGSVLGQTPANRRRYATFNVEYKLTSVPFSNELTVPSPTEEIR